MWPNSRFPLDLVTFTEEIINEKRSTLVIKPRILESLAL